MQTRSDLADDVASSAPTHADSKKIRKLLRSYNASLQPTFPADAAPELRSHFIAEVSDPEAAAKLCEHLAKTNGVEAAYIKPADEAP